MDQPIEKFEVNFEADAHIIQILGEQLIGSEKVGILELIKNAYDASASRCDVWIEKCPNLTNTLPSDPEVLDLPGPVITIVDDGIGMDLDTIKNGWLRPATIIKTSVKERLKREREQAIQRGTVAEYESIVGEIKRGNKGRLPLGEKGVGRFATQRLGRYLKLQTKTKNDPYEWVLEIDWNLFNLEDYTPKNLNTVKLSLIKRFPSRDYGETGSGTILRIYGGRSGFEWTTEKLQDIGWSIAYLKSPHKKENISTKKSGFETTSVSVQKGFTVNFYAPQTEFKEFRVPTETVPAPITCIAVVDDDGIADIEIALHPPKSLRKPLPANKFSTKLDLKEHPPVKVDVGNKYWLETTDIKKKRKPLCGPFILDVKVWIRSSEWVEAPNFTQFTKYLDEFGGIGVYRDGLGIIPAQNTSRDDWLGLAARQIKKADRISYYNMAGSVDLEQEKTPLLIDRTSREGMLETQAFEDLVVLLQTIITVFIEDYFKKVRESYKKLLEGERIPEAELTKQAQLSTKVFDLIANKYDFLIDPIGFKYVIKTSDDPQAVFKTLGNTIDELKREVKALQTQSDALIEAAGFGIAIAVALHEIEKITSNIYFGLEDLLSKPSALSSEAFKKADKIHLTSGALLTELRRLAPLRVTRLEQARTFQIRDCIIAASSAFRSTWDDLKIMFIPPDKGDSFSIYGSYGMCSQIFANLFDNSTYWITSTASEERRITVRLNQNQRRVIVADSGPGIDPLMGPNLFKLYYSLKNPPSGLGLYICQYYMRQIGGSIRETYEVERVTGFKGAQFTIFFPEKD